MLQYSQIGTQQFRSMDHTQSSEMQYSLARSAILNKVLQPSSTANTKPLSNLTKILVSFDSRMTSMEEQLHLLSNQTQSVREELKSTQQRLILKNNEVHTHLQARINHDYEQTIKKNINEALRRYAEAKGKADGLEMDLGTMTKNFKKLNNRIQRLENMVGYYSGKDKLLG